MPPIHQVLRGEKLGSPILMRSCLRESVVHHSMLQNPLDALLLVVVFTGCGTVNMTPCKSCCTLAEKRRPAMSRRTLGRNFFAKPSPRVSRMDFRSVRPPANGERFQVK